MANLKEIRSRINSVKNTEQMTQAMKMVSVARLKQAQNRILNLRDYAQGLKELMSHICLSQKISHPFLEEKKELKKVLLLLVTSDRGLCGGFNGNICRFTEKFLEEKNYPEEALFFIGRKGRDYFKFRGIKGQGTILNLVKEVSYPFAEKISVELMKNLSESEYDAVFFHYNEFKTIISPEIKRERLLPFDKTPFEADKKQAFKDLLFEVPPQVLLKDLLKKYFSVQIYRILCESIAAEHGSRMAAMESATKNAGEAIDKLTLNYNKLRQANITTELTEIIGGVEALKS